MINIRITLHDNTVYDVTLEEYLPEMMATELNDQKLLVVTIGDIILNRGAIKSIVRIEETVV